MIARKLTLSINNGSFSHRDKSHCGLSLKIQTSTASFNTLRPNDKKVTANTLVSNFLQTRNILLHQDLNILFSESV